MVGKSVTLFDCGHIYHKNCLQRGQVCPLCDSEEQKFSRRQAGPAIRGPGNDQPARGHLRGRELDDVSKDVPTKRYIKRLEFAERRNKQQGSRFRLATNLQPLNLPRDGWRGGQYTIHNTQYTIHNTQNPTRAILDDSPPPYILIFYF